MPQGFVGAPNGTMWGYDPTTHLWLPVQVGPLQTDATTGEEYAPLLVQSTGTAAITAASGAIVDLPSKFPNETSGLSVNVLNGFLVPATDISNYAMWSLQISGVWTGTLTFQGCNSGLDADFVNTNVYNLGSGGSLNQTQTVNGVYFGPRTYRFLRVKATAWTSGTANGLLELFSYAPSWLMQFALQVGTWTVQPGNTQNTTPWLVAGPNVNGVQAANSAANTVIKGSPGWLFHAIVTTLGTAGLTIYDNASGASGTPLLVIPPNAAVGTIYSFPSGARAVNGITSAGVANCPAVTFHYT